MSARHRLSSLCVFMLSATALSAAEGPHLFFSKSFPGSTPAYVQIDLNKNGDVQYREAPDDDQPLTFHLSAADTKQVFDLAQKVDYFKHPLESPLKVAFMGTKTFRYENGAQKSEVKFNFSEDPAARDLLDWFEKMAESAQHRIELERTAKYDKLGVVNALIQLQSALERNRLVAPDQFLPILDRIIKNETYMHTARVRAAEIAEAIRAPKP
jgi:hypothetical protein